MSLDGFNAELFWSMPREAGKLEPWIAQYKASVDAAWRTPLVDTLRDLHASEPIRTLCEVGCHCGPMFRRLMRDVPAIAGVHFLGVDASADAIAEAQTWNAHYHRAIWQRSALRSGLTFLADKVADVTYTSTCLASVAPSDLQPAIATLWRITRRVLVLYEPQREQASGLFREWKHDYAAAVGAVGATAIILSPKEKTG